MSRIDGYIIVAADGTIKSKRKVKWAHKYATTAFYLDVVSAKRCANKPGDAVVALGADLSVAPVFIRGLTP